MRFFSLRCTLGLGGFLATATAALGHPLPLITNVPNYVSQLSRSFDQASNVPYNGGPVLSSVKIVAVLWGSDVDATVTSDIGPFYQALANSTFLDWLNIYDTNVSATDGRSGTQQTIGRGSYAGLVTITPQNAGDQLAQADIESEIDRQIDAGTLPVPDANTMYMIHFPGRVGISISWGASCETWCADHEAYNSPKHGEIYYAMMPACLAGCGSGSAFDSISEAASHELAEAVTDPECPQANLPIVYPAAWLRSDGQEVGDLCAWVGTTLSSQGKSYSVQSIWSNTTSSCNSGPFTNP